MDWQAAFNVAFAVAAGAVGWMLKAIYDAIRDLRDEDSKNQSAHGDLHDRITRVTEGLPGTYMRRDDFSAFAGRVEDALGRIESKLDRKADK